MKHKNIEKCNRCGICNLDSPEYLTTRDETVSPRNMVKLASEGKNSTAFYSSLAGVADCFKNCPVGVKLDMISLREALIKEGKTTEANEIMKNNIKQHGTPFGDLSRAKNIKKYYT